MVVAPAIYKNIGYDPAQVFAPVAALFNSPQVLAVHPSTPVNSLQELVAYAKANPGKVNFLPRRWNTAAPARRDVPAERRRRYRPRPL